MVVVGVDEFTLSYGITAPKKEDYATTTLGKSTDGGICELLPTVMLVATGQMGTNRKGSVEQQYPLLGPSAEVTTGVRDSSP